MAPNLLECNFSSGKPLEKLSTDVSYIKCTDGRLYLSAVKDLFNKQIISHFSSDKNDINLVMKTLEKVKSNRGIIHSDQGSLYYSGKYVNYPASRCRSLTRFLSKIRFVVYPMKQVIFSDTLIFHIITNSFLSSRSTYGNCPIAITPKLSTP